MNNQIHYKLIRNQIYNQIRNQISNLVYNLINNPINKPDKITQKSLLVILITNQITK